MNEPTAFTPRFKAKRIKFTLSDTETLTRLHKSGETLDTICQVLDRPMGTIATKVRELIGKGILENRLRAAMGPRPGARKVVQS